MLPKLPSSTTPSVDVELMLSIDIYRAIIEQIDFGILITRVPSDNYH